MLAQSETETRGALQTSLNVTLSGATDQVRDAGSKLSIHPDPSFSATMRANPPRTFFGPISTLAATFVFTLSPPATSISLSALFCSAFRCREAPSKLDSARAFANRRQCA